MSYYGKDYYKVLGVDKNVTTEEIKSAFRRLAKKFHPDVNPGNKEAERRFKEINEAHDVLSDPEKRRKYDIFNKGVGMEEQKVNKEADEQFCPSCGKVVKKEAVICVHCGVAIKKGDGTSKDKTVSILLAIFLAFWTWLYTYKKDSGKFWLNLILYIVTLGLWGIVAWIWAIINVATKPDS